VNEIPILKRIEISHHITREIPSRPTDINDVTVLQTGLHAVAPDGQGDVVPALYRGP
jgi:hypothetical protein